MPIDIASPAETRAVRRIVEDVVGCKWTLHVLAQVRHGVQRPGRLVRTAEGLTTKVLNERLAKLVRYGVLEKRTYAEIPPRVEYHLTPLGERLNGVLDAIDALQRDVDAGQLAATPPCRPRRATHRASPSHSGQA